MIQSRFLRSLPSMDNCSNSRAITYTRNDSILTLLAIPEWKGICQKLNSLIVQFIYSMHVLLFSEISVAIIIMLI